MTYRLYDYGRLENGKPRELHISKALDVIDFSGKDVTNNNFSNTKQVKTLMCKCDKFSVYLLNINGKESFTQDQSYLNCSVIEGSGKIDGQEIVSGDSFILPNNYGEFQIEGNLKLIVSHV